MNSEQNQKVEWCPGAESNHRHEDFQSTALPLSYPGTGERFRSGGSLLVARGERVQRGRCRILCPLISPLIGAFVLGAGDHVTPRKPAPQIDIGAAARAEGAVFGAGGAGADRAGHESQV